MFAMPASAGSRWIVKSTWSSHVVDLELYNLDSFSKPVRRYTHLESDVWTKSRLEPAMFFLRKEKSQLLGILVTHVDDLAGGVRQDYVQRAFQKSSKALATTSRSLFSEAER
jgi:hypothetical protein